MAQPLVAGGATIVIQGVYLTAFSGSIKLPTNNVSGNQIVRIAGLLGPLSGVPSPSGGTFVYAIQMALSPGMSTTMQTMGANVITLNMPSTVSTAKPLNLYKTSFPFPAIGATAPPVTWSIPVQGTRSGNTESFTILNVSIPPNSLLLFYITQ